MSESILKAGSEGGIVMPAVAWSQSVLGPVADWPQSLRSAVSICLASPYPMAIYWGPELALIYNDAWSPILGTKHPDAMGRPGREVWPEIWHLVGPQLMRSLSHGESTRQPDGLLPMHRHGYVEECYFDYSFSPIRSEGGHIGGVFNAVVETTYRVVNARRTRLLKTISDGTALLASDEQVCIAAAEAIATDPQDVPFALLYLNGGGDTAMHVAGSCGITDAQLEPLRETSPQNDPWQMAAVSTASGYRVLPIPEALARLELGPWPEAPHLAAVIPFAAGESGRVGVLVVGISARRGLDEDYHRFLEALGDQITRALTNARKIAEDRRRAEALAAIDRAKTAFFSNVSHEFRTPLTLMLGPIEDGLRDVHDPLSPHQRERLELIQRNGIRLLRLVNTLLDFSRIEAGRARAAFTATDLGEFTADLASTFRSTIEAAGLHLVVDCPHLDDPMFIDRDMWEKIVLNLLSNAFKHTFAGQIAVRLRASDGRAVLRVEDTGIGIPPDQVPRLFERFHRVLGARSRTHEGSGIGLALVHELVRLHGGTVSIESEVDRGSTFMVAIPVGHAHLRQEDILSKAPSDPPLTHAAPFVDEAIRWLPDVPGTSSASAPGMEGAPARDPDDWILLADDNSDMREYVRRLLASRWHVTAVSDGEQALAVARQRRPGLILTDVMMPRLDGFGLLRAIRADVQLRDVPVILLSARAGEEAGIEGREAGADDYLTKPFSAHDLIARVSAHFQLKRLRASVSIEMRSAVERLSLAQISASFGLWEYDPVGQRGYFSAECAQLFGYSPDLSPEENVAESFRRIHPEDIPLVKQRLAEATSGSGTVTWEYRFRHPERGDRWLMSRARCVSQEPAAPRVIGVTVDLTAEKSAEVAIENEKNRWRNLAEAMPNLVWTCTADGRCDYLSRQWIAYTGRPEVEQLGNGWQDQLHPDDRAIVAQAWQSAVANAQPFDLEFRIRRHDGLYRWFKTRAVAAPEPAGEPIKWYGTNTDITALKEAELELTRRAEALDRANGELQHFASIASHDLQEPLRMISSYADILGRRYGSLFDDKASDYFKRITSGAQRMRDLINAILAYSQVDKIQPDLQDVMTADALRDALEHLHTEIIAKQAQVSVGALPTLRADRIRLTQLFQNLVSNSLKFACAHRSPEIAITAAAGEEEWVFSVADNGIGIPLDSQTRIFRIFQRLHAPGAYPGSGIGLASCKKIVDQLGGRMWVESVPDCGSTFFFTIPHQH